MTFYLLSEELAKQYAETNLKPTATALVKEENTPHTPRLSEHLDHILASLKDIKNHDHSDP